MARQKLEDIVSYIETKLATVNDLDTIVYTDAEDTPPVVSTYGAHIYWTPGQISEQERRHIGDKLTIRWFLNVDVIINKHFQTQRKAVSDPKGTSYWIDLMRDLFLNGTNSGVFDSSQWALEDIETDTDNYTLKGIFTCEVVSTYS